MRACNVKVAEVSAIGLVPVEIAFVGAAARGGGHGREEVGGGGEDGAAVDKVVVEGAVEADLRGWS